MRRLSALTASLSIALVACGTSAAVGTPDPVTLSLEPTVVAPGGLYTAVLSGCQPPFEGPGETVVFSIDEEPVGSAVCGSNRTASAQIDAPSTPGVYTIVGDSLNGSDSAELTVRLPLELSLSPAAVTTGAVFTAVLSGCLFDVDDAETVEFTIDGTSAGTAECESGNRATAELTAPTEPGEYEVEGASENGTASATLTVRLPVTLSLSPPTVETSAPFTAVLSGCRPPGDGPGETVEFTIDGTSAGTAECDSGNGATAELTAPAEPGDYQVQGTSENGSAFADLAVRRPVTLSLSPSTVETGAAFTAGLSGCVFDGDGAETVEFTIDGTSAGTAECESGNSATAELTAPAEPGEYEVQGTSENGTASATVTVIAPLTLSLSPPTVATGAGFTATLDGCTVGGSVDFSVEGDSATTECVGSASDSSARVELNAPGVPGQYDVAGSDTGSERAAEATLTVISSPVLTLSPSTVVTGAAFTATLSGCAANEPVEFTVEGYAATDECANGAATAELTAPSIAAVYSVDADLTESGRSASAQLTVQRRELPEVELSVPRAVVGTAFTATMRGCVAGEQVQFTVEGDSAATSCEGESASAELTAPQAPGIYRVDGVATESAAAAFAEIIVHGPPEDALVLADSTVGPGEVFVVALRGCIVGEEVEFTVAGDSDTSECEGVTLGAAGEAVFVFQEVSTAAVGELTAPSEPGQYTVEGTALTSGLTDTAVITVVDLTGGPTPTTTTPPTIPVTL